MIVRPDSRRRPPFTLSRDDWGQLVLIDDAGLRHENVAAIPLFPLTDPEHWISLCAADGRELACVENPAGLPPETAELLHDELSRSRFIPAIERITYVSGSTEPCEWRVETDRGPTRFVLKSEDDVRRLGPQQILIVDGGGLRYHIPDLTRLDPKSRRIVEWYV
jgi:Mg2+ and Co2+ transporter CorA